MMTKSDDDMLNAAFADLRETPPPASDDLMTRVMQDADRMLAQNLRSRVAPTFREMLRDIIGGWPQLGGLAAATVAGVWLGVAQPGVMRDLSVGFHDSTIEVPMLDSDIFAALEG